MIADGVRFEKILQSHSVRYPGWQVQDVYKLVHQAALGPGHMVADAESARTWLERELAEMGEGPAEPVIDPISKDGEVVRVHLRPYLAGGGDLNTLLSAFVETANEFNGRAGLLEEYLAQVVRRGTFPSSEVEAFFEEMKVGGYPAVHHSERYKNLYRPAYRVVEQKYLAAR